MSKGVDHIIFTPQYERALSKLKRSHKHDVVKRINETVDKLANYEISTQGSNHKLNDSNGLRDIHIQHDVILLYRYTDHALIITLELNNIVNHDQLQKKIKVGKKMKIRSSRDYGGAYDIDPNQYFTREDLIEFADAVIDKVNSAHIGQFDYTDIYIVDYNHVVLDIESDNGWYSSSVTFDIDMRRIMKPQDLNKYVALAADELIKDIESQQGGSEEVESSTSVKSSIYDVPERPLDPPEGPEYDEETENVKLEIRLDAVIHVGDDGFWDYEDEQYPWAADPTDSQGDWHSPEFGVFIGSKTDIAEYVDEVLVQVVPAQPYTYHITGEVTLVFRIDGIQSHITRRYEDEGGYGNEVETAVGDAHVNFIFDESKVSDFKFEVVESEV